MIRRLLVRSAATALLLGVLILSNVPAGATTSKLHLSVWTVDGQIFPNGEFNCGFVFTTFGSPYLINRFTVSVVNAKGRVDKDASGTVTATVSSATSASACHLQSLGVTDSTVLYNASAQIVHGVATLADLNAAAPGSYVLNFSGDGLVYTGRSILLGVAGPGDVTTQVPVQITVTRPLTYS